MLIQPLRRTTWLVGGIAAAVALVAGIAVAAVLGPTQPSRSASGAALFTAQVVDCDDPNDPNCSVGDGEGGEDPPPDIPGGNGGGACTFTRPGGLIEVSLAQEPGETFEIPCVHEDYGFFDGDHCYWTSDYPPLYQPPAEPPEGKDPNEGQWYFGTCFTDAYYFNGLLVLEIQAALFNQWFDYADVPVVTPEQVAQDWLATVELVGIDFALAPPETGVGVVSLPVWLGVNETQNSWGEISDTHCIAGVCVSITAFVESVDWNMGDGTSFTCDRGEHKVWNPSLDYLRPDGCHHYYQRASRNQPGGKYQITATSNWSVEWVSQVSDASGVLTTSREASTALQINEIQVLTQ
ncbi:MAG TPA: hypothetical protein VIL37_05605 [Natronosporangium sp.]